MKLRYLFVFCFLFSVAPKFGVAEMQSNMIFSDQVRQELLLKGQSDVLMYFPAANIEQASSKMRRIDRIQYVYNTLRSAAKQSQKEVIQYLEVRKIPYRSFYIVNAIMIDGATSELLGELPIGKTPVQVKKNLRFRAEDPKVNYLRTGQPGLSGVQESLKKIGAEKVWTELGIRGEGIVVAGEDTGIDWTHPALKRQYRGYNGLSVMHDYSWHDAIHNSFAEIKESNCVKDSPAPCDDRGHGTHTMGTMVGADPQGNIYGVAPNAKWIGCRNMDGGVGTVASYLECFEFFLAPYPRGGSAQTDGRPDMAPHMINNSWGCPANEGCKGDEFLASIRVLQSAGILFIASAGNDGSSCGSTKDAPGFYSGEIISVAAMDHRNGEIADFSSRGPSLFNGGTGPTITAPGVDIYSAIPKGSGWSPNDLYESKSGTSMSGPHVVGVAALLWSAKPDLIGKIPETMSLLHRTADPRTSSQNCGSYPGAKVPNAVWGYGVVNAFRAITGRNP